VVLPACARPRAGRQVSQNRTGRWCEPCHGVAVCSCIADQPPPRLSAFRRVAVMEEADSRGAAGPHRLEERPRGTRWRVEMGPCRKARMRRTPAALGARKGPAHQLHASPMVSTLSVETRPLSIRAHPSVQALWYRLRWSPPAPPGQLCATYRLVATVSRSEMTHHPNFRRVHDRPRHSREGYPAPLRERRTVTMSLPHPMSASPSEMSAVGVALAPSSAEVEEVPVDVTG